MSLEKMFGRLRVAVALVAITWPCLAQDRIEVSPVVRELNQAFINVAEQVSPTVVVINVAHRSSFEADAASSSLEEGSDRFRGLFEEKGKKNDAPDTGDSTFDSQGSGVVVRKDGYILTNRHVVDGAVRIEVRFSDGRRFPAEIRGMDLASDLAVLKIKAETDFAVARLGDSSATRVGEFAIAIGAPFELDYSVTFGHISAKGRAQIIPDPVLDQDFLQTDADINPGNSGGPLVNIYGEVIGINTLIRGLRTGIGFAIPINLARDVSDQLIQSGRFVRAYLGIVIRGLRDDPEYASLLQGLGEGVLVTEVRRGGPAKSKLQPSDIITAVDGKAVGTTQQLRAALRSKPVGRSITFDVHRKDKAVKITITPEAWPEEKPLIKAPVASPPDLVANVIGVTVQKMDAAWSQSLGLEESQGVLVTEVQRESPADSAGIRPGDVITEVNRESVMTVEQFQSLLKNADLKKGVMIHFISRDMSKFRILKAEK